MATNLAIDDALITEAQKLGQCKTKKAVVTEALLEYIQRKKQVAALEALGSIDFDDSYDYKQHRAK